MKFTPSQQKAIDTRDKNILLSAGAGSGKTAVLTQRISKLIVEEKKDISTFLITTFTNAAAENMKSKIKKKLYEAAEKTQDISEKKRLMSQAQMTDFGDIGTMHAFCKKLVCKYYYQLGLDPSLSVLSDATRESIIGECLDAVLEEYYELADERFFKLLSSFPTFRAQERLKDIVRSLFSASRLDINPSLWLKRGAKENIQTKEDLINSEAFQYLMDYFYSLLQHAFTVLANVKSLLSGDEYAKISQVIYDDELKMKRLMEKIEARCFEEFMTLLSATSFLRFPIVKNLDESCKAPFKNAHSEAKDMVAKIKKALPFSLDTELELIKTSNELYGVLFEITEKFAVLFAEKKKEKNLIDYDDMEHFMLELLTIDDIRKEIQSSYEFVYCDEYQDTSAVQEEILKRVSKEDNFFAVGDVKQSIYSFRGGRADIFVSRSDLYEKETKKNALIYLNTNFRSSRFVASSINDVFETIMNRKMGECDYGENEKMNVPESVESRIKSEVHILDISTLPIEEDFDFGETSDIVTDKKTLLEAKHCAALIKEYMNLDIYDKEIDAYRKARFSDIAILAKSVKKISPVFYDVFRSEGINIQVRNESDYFSFDEVHIIMDVLCLIDNSQNDSALVSVLKNFFANITFSEMVKVRNRFACYFFYECVDRYTKEETDATAEKLREFTEVINSFRKFSKTNSVAALIEKIYSYHGFFSILTSGSDSLTKRDVLRALVLKAREFDRIYMGSLSEFISQMYSSDKAAKSESVLKTNTNSKECVSMMTIHKSKGLEFPFVIVVGAGADILKKPPIWAENIVDNVLGLCPSYTDIKRKIKTSTIKVRASKFRKRAVELNEALRLLYVAMSRAMEKLVLVGSVRDAGKYLESPFLPDGVSLDKSPSFLRFVLSALFTKQRTILSAQSSLMEFENFNIRVFNCEDVTKNTAAEFRLDTYLSHNFDTNAQKKVRESFLKKYVPTEKSKISAKLSVSKIKDGLELEIGEKMVEFIDPTRTSGDPFKRGNALHFALEHIDFKRYLAKNPEEINLLLGEEISFLKSEYPLFGEDFLEEDKELLRGFLLSSLAKQISKSSKVYRETPFNLKVSAKEIYEDAHSNVFVTVQGIIDLFFTDVETNRVVVVDYKSDFAFNEARHEKYKKQISFYKKALCELYNKDAEYECYIYYLTQNKTFKVENN